jgi:hypothetical protein
LNYPATSALIRFLYRFAEFNQPAADQFYAQALAIYGDKPMREFLYLQAYPFAWRETLNTPFVPNYQVPAKFVTKESLQRRFIEVLLRRAQQAVEGPIDESDVYRSATVNLLPGKVHLLNGLIRLEPQIRTLLPDLTPALIEAREKILVSLSVETQKLLLQPGREVSTTPDTTFDERIEAGLKLPDIDERDEMIATAIFGSEKERLTDVIKAIDKVNNANLRSHLFEWFYFHRAITAIKEKRFEDAERLISRVEGHEQRAFLYAEMAEELLKGPETRTYAAQILDDSIAEAKKAGTTIFAARTLLTASSLYAKLDLSRSIGILGDATNYINRIEAPDFSSDDQALEKKPQRRGRGGAYRGEYVFRFYMPGLDPESAFREMAKIDFDTSLSQSSALTDKFQRAMSTLALAEVCLQQIQERPKPKKTAKP